MNFQNIIYQHKFYTISSQYTSPYSKLPDVAARLARVEGAKAIYDLTKCEGKDPYELFLSGKQPVVTLKNSDVTRQKRLIMFRDSFGSSLAPLMLAGYREIVLVDLRYLSIDQVGKYVDFQRSQTETDVLFLYSTSLLNNSLAIQ